MSTNHSGRVLSINVSSGGVPKLPVARAGVTANGVEGDRQNDTRHHGGPMRAVCLFSAEVIERLRGEGHPIAPGTAGENLTLEGIDWPGVGVGSRFVFDGGVELEVTDYTSPCKTIAPSFRDREFKRILQKLHPGESRVYTRVLVEGDVAAGEGVRLVPPTI